MRIVDDARARGADYATRRVIPSESELPAPWHQRTWVWATIGALIVLLLTPLAALAWYQYDHVDRIYDGVSALGVDLGGMTREEAERALAARANELAGRPVVVRAADAEWRTDWSQLGLRIPATPIVERAMAVGRDGSPVQRAVAQIDALGSGMRLPVEQSFDEQVLREFVSSVAGRVDRPVRDARLELKPDLTLELTTAQTGRTVVVDESLRRLHEAALSGAGAVELAVATTQPTTTDEMRQAAKERAERMLAAPLVLSYGDRRWTIEGQELADLLMFTGGPGLPLEVKLDPDALLPRLTGIAAELGQPAQDARLDWNGGQPKVIQPSREGRSLDPGATVELIAQRAPDRERTIPLPVEVARPAVDEARIGQMGLRELIDSATTSFTGSVPQKAHNIRLAASRLHGVVVAPRALFSFNKALGPTTIDNGYQTALGSTGTGEGFRTVPSVAGGICQVATTLFQPVFWSGY